MRKTINDLTALPDGQFDQLALRMEAAKTLRNLKCRSRLDVKLIAEKLGVNPATVYRDMARLEGRGTVTDLAPRDSGWPAGRSKIKPRQEELIDKFLKELFLTPAKPSMVKAVEKIGDACEAEGHSRPSRATVIRRLSNISPRTVALKRQGPKAAEQQTPRPGSYNVKQPWDVWQIDHTLSDVIILDRKQRPIGRAWLTLIIDVCTRVVPAFYVGLEPPSAIRVATALDLAVGPKDPWLRQYRYDYEYPIFGLPRLLHSDRAKEFTSPVLVRALKNQGVDTFLRPPGRTRFGGHIERLIGTVMGTCRLLPGATHHSPAARGKYDSKASARLNLDELQDYFAHEILGVYHHRIHSALGVSPLECWKSATEGSIPELPDDAEAFRLDLFPELNRTIGRQGIKAFGDLYYSDEVGVAFTQGCRDTVIKYDPRNLSHIYCRLNTNSYTSIPLRVPREGPPIPLWLYKASRRSLGETNKHQPHRDVVQRATAAAEKIIEDASARSGKAARQVERLARERAATGYNGINEAVQPSYDPDWDGAFDEEQ